MLDFFEVFYLLLTVLFVGTFVTFCEKKRFTVSGKTFENAKLLDYYETNWARSLWAK